MFRGEVVRVEIEHLLPEFARWISQILIYIFKAVDCKTLLVMVSDCCVPQCSERSYGHAFPKDLKLRKQCLHVIRRDLSKPTKQSRVCYKHFKQDDYYEQSWASKEAGIKHQHMLKPGSVLSAFQWSSGQTNVLSCTVEEAKAG